MILQKAKILVNDAERNGTVLAAVQNFKSEPFKLRTMIMFLHDDTIFSNSASLADNFFSKRAIIGERANRIESRAFMNGAAEHRVEINAVERIIRTIFKKIIAIGVDDFNLAHGLQNVRAIVVEVLQTVANNFRDKRINL